VDLLADDHAVGQAEAPHVAGERRERLAGEYKELEGLARADARGGFQQEVDALAVRRVDECTTRTSSPRSSSRRTTRASGWAGAERRSVDDLDRAVEVEHGAGFRA